MTGVPLFIAEPTGTCRLALRRFRLNHGAGEHFHNVSVVIDENAAVTPRNPDGSSPVTDKRIPHDDPRWPQACSCGERFRDDDHWQVNELDWYLGAGHSFAWGVGSWDGPPGAMIRAEWRDQPGRPDAWTVFLPNGSQWCTNDYSSDGDHLGPQWTVTGTAPQLTVSPSIDDRSPSRPWHGWIRAGVLEPA